MSETILLGRGNQIEKLPRETWEKHLSQISQHGPERLGFMTDEHQRVRYFAVKELPRVGKPLKPEVIAQGVDLPLDRVVSILDDLERHLTFLVRDEAGAVSWAFPVTVDQTPHRITFKSGERLYGA
jgi:hypothetical protein